MHSNNNVYTHTYLLFLLQMNKSMNVLSQMCATCHDLDIIVLHFASISLISTILAYHQQLSAGLWVLCSDALAHMHAVHNSKAKSTIYVAQSFVILLFAALSASSAGY